LFVSLHITASEKDSSISPRRSKSSSSSYFSSIRHTEGAETSQHSRRRRRQRQNSNDAVGSQCGDALRPVAKHLPSHAPSRERLRGARCSASPPRFAALRACWRARSGAAAARTWARVLAHLGEDGVGVLAQRRRRRHGLRPVIPTLPTTATSLAN
jgi:hypothetical protein